MVDKETVQDAPQRQVEQLDGGTYEIIRQRLTSHGQNLRERMDKLNAARKEVFGAIETTLLSSQRITTENNCVPRDMVAIGSRFIFGYNVFVGLRAQTELSDVFAVYAWRDGALTAEGLDLIQDATFAADFANLQKYYRHARFAKFAVIGAHLFMVFRVGKHLSDIKTFKWLIRGDALAYCDNRSDHEYVFPPQHEFDWVRVTQDMHRAGTNPHISIEDRVFIETIGGDLTIKIEDNTETGEGIYREPVDDPDQTLVDADIHYALVDSLILLKVRPYQEKDYRYFIYNEKNQEAVRIDALKDACVLLPDDQGIIFPNGYYLQTGERKEFPIEMQDLIFEKRISSPNGEDYLYEFYNREQGVYVLLSYNVIDQKVETPVICHGYSYFNDGTMLYFRAEEEAQKHHVVQVWQTPYYGPDYDIEIHRESELYKIGNKDIVRCMAECSALLNLVGKDESYANLYLDIAKLAQDINDAFFWLNTPGAFQLSEPLAAIAQTASSAIEEYEKVVRTRENTRKEFERVRGAVREVIEAVNTDAMDDVDAFVRHLSQLRGVRGEVVSLKELRYADVGAIETLETEVAEVTEQLSGACVEYLLKPDALIPYQQRVETLRDRIPDLAKASEAKELQAEAEGIGGELEMLTEIVSNLKIADATQTTAIIDNISLVFATVNQAKSSLKNKLSELASVEGRAEFSAQLKLLDQSVINFLDLCDTPEKCDEFLTRATVQLDTMEGKFADFDEFILELTDKREELFSAFETRKVQLTAERNQRAAALMTSAERVLKGIENRADKIKDVNEINGFFASDLMVERVRETVERLQALGDAVKADDVKSRLKTLQQDALRQLKDRQALYEDGEDIIRLGSHRFSVNRQSLEVTMVRRDGQMFYHLTGSGFFEPVTDETFLETRDLWDLDLVSETPDIYRAEYLAYVMFGQLSEQDAAKKDKLRFAEPVDVLREVQQFMGPRYAEGYVKGVHDHDAAKILQTLLQMETEIGLLRHGSSVRAQALLFWRLWNDDAQKTLLAEKIGSIGRLGREFGTAGCEDSYKAALAQAISAFRDEFGIVAADAVCPAADYLFDELSQQDKFCVSQIALDIEKAFRQDLSREQMTHLQDTLGKLSADPAGAFKLLCDWLSRYLQAHDGAVEYVEEVAVLMLQGDAANRHVLAQAVQRELTEMHGAHGRLDNGTYRLHYSEFMGRLRRHAEETAPRFEAYQTLKKQRVEDFAESMRLSEFQPRVLTSFVRNKLIDKVYLPLIGDNLAKQLGTTGDEKRTDRQGLLLLISPPGYGKTTLMEYVANRLGVIFVKINGPSIGHRVTSFDPAEAPNAAAREELAKLNLSLEMGDNIMIYLDDIQHCNPELLQKFISLCDAQRRVEGVHRGKSRTYDLRGKRVCVVMAGNPYTESGEKFKIPDMLANRADTYNIGDIVGNNRDVFILSYIENCLTSNSVLRNPAHRNLNDIYTMLKMAETGQREGLEFEGNYSVDELNEYVSVLKKLLVVRDVVLRVNQQYILSAGQTDAYRTEPPFLLQGSYRNMNRIAERVLPVMNDEELWTLIYSNYEQDAQTLTSGAESNLLKFRELTDRLTDDDTKRWQEIKKRFGRNLLMGSDTEDKASQLIGQLSVFGDGLHSIKDVLTEGVQSMSQKAAQRESDQTKATDSDAESRREHAEVLETFKGASGELVGKLDRVLDELQTQRQQLSAQAGQLRAQEAEQNADMLLSVLEEQFNTMDAWLMRVTRNRHGQEEYVNELIHRFETMIKGYGEMIEFLRQRYHPDSD